jgi:hypothetical protein
MAVLTAEKRKRLASALYGLPGERKYPMPDKNHAKVALGRATQMENAGKLSPQEAAKVRAKAHEVLNK